MMKMKPKNQNSSHFVLEEVLLSLKKMISLATPAKLEKMGKS
uniref:Uncharacterized protein n=1 Tax=Rhizophora mucronata TaxID=61149 RepID=A0A2P2QV96_RHIMU